MLRTNVLLPLLCFLASAAKADDAQSAIDRAVASVTKPSAANITNDNICVSISVLLCQGFLYYSISASIPHT